MQLSKFARAQSEHVKLSIIHCVVYFVPKRVGGIEIYVHALAKQLQNLGHDVKILVPQYSGDDPYPLDVDGISVLSYAEEESTKKKEFSGKALSKLFSGFVGHLSNEKPDIVHFHQLTSSNGVSLHHLREAKRLGAKVVFTNHLAGLTCNSGTMLLNGRIPCDGKVELFKCTRCSIRSTQSFKCSYLPLTLKKHLRYVEMFIQSWRSVQLKKQRARALMKTCDKIILIATWYQDVLERNYMLSSNSCVIKQALPSESQIEDKISVSSKNRINAVYVGRISPEKGLHILLKALQGVSLCKINLDIYGQSTDEEYLLTCQNLAAGTHNIKWHGVIENEKIVSIVAEHDVLIIPSCIAEMAPLILQESFSARTPVIAARIAGITEEIVHGENGLLFSPNDVEELRLCINLIISKPDLLKKFAARLPIPRTFETLAKQVEEQYYKIL